MAVIQIRLGDTFETTSLITATVDGTPVTDFTGYTFKSSLFDRRGFETALTVVQAGSTGALTISDTDTSDWPLGILYGDILVTSPAGVKEHSAPFHVEVKRGWTK